MTVHHHDGGRKAAGYKGKAGDCVTRAIAIAAGKDYQEVWDGLASVAATMRQTRMVRKSLNPSKGVGRPVWERYLRMLGAEWVPTMGIGTGCRVHLTPLELPMGRLVCRVSRHMVAVVDRKIYDTYDSTRNGTRCVYGYWRIKQ